YGLAGRIARQVSEVGESYQRQRPSADNWPTGVGVTSATSWLNWAGGGKWLRRRLDRFAFQAEHSKVAVERQGLTFDDRAADCVHRIEDVDEAESLALKSIHRTLHLIALPADNPRGQIPIRATPVSRHAQLLRQVEDDGDRQAILLGGQGNQ